MATLTKREREIVVLLGQGMAPKQIALRLGTKPRTVRNQLYNARDKAGCESVVELAVRVALGSKLEK